MHRSTANLRFVSICALLGLVATTATAQTSRRTLERPKEYDLPALSSSTTRNTVSSRTNSKIPDPSIFDGSKFPPEERPERGLLANMERPGEEPPPVPGPGQEEGAGGQQQGGGDQQMAGGGGAGGGGSGDGEQGSGGAPSAPAIAGLPPIAQSGGGSGGEGEEQEGEQGQPGQPGGPNGPKPPPGAQGRQLEKPSAVQIGDPNAALAETQKPTASASAQLESKPGEARMQVKAAQGSQSSNRGKGTERGKDIPSNL